MAVGGVILAPEESQSETEKKKVFHSADSDHAVVGTWANEDYNSESFRLGNLLK